MDQLHSHKAVEKPITGPLIFHWFNTSSMFSRYNHTHSVHLIVPIFICEAGGTSKVHKS